MSFESFHNSFFMVSGVGFGTTELNSFDDALLNSGIGDFNIVRMSSILPPKSRNFEAVFGRTNITSPFPGIIIPRGSLIPVAYSSLGSELINPARIPRSNINRIFASVAVAIPEDDEMCGLIMENHGDVTEENNEFSVDKMLIEGMGRRGRKIKNTIHRHIDHCVYNNSDSECNFSWVTVFAGVVLCKNGMI